MIGQLLTGRYLILKKLGAGGFSETYLARDKYLPHHPLCVVKCLQLSSSSTISQETAQRLFETEAYVLAHLGRQHAQIPTLFAYCHEQDQVYQVQEYIDGENLGDWVAQGRRLTPETAIALLLEVLPVLDYIHAHGVIHRDIKPSNLIRRHRDGKVVLIDFGAARLVTNQESELRPEGDDVLVAIGTPGYMPDEQNTGTSQFSSDLYSLGILVIHLLTGVHPREFLHDPISGELDWRVHLNGQSTDPKLLEILNRMVRSHPRDRFQCAADVLTALQSLSASPNRTKRAEFHWSVPVQRQSAKQLLKPIAATLLLVGMIAGVLVYGRMDQAKIAMMWLNAISHQTDNDLILRHELPVDTAVDRMLIAPNNRILVTAETDHALRLWSLDNGTRLNILSGHTGKVTALGMSQDSRLLVSGGEDRTIRLWDASSGNLLWTSEQHPTTVTAVAISSDARTLASGSQDGTVRLWDVQTGKLLQTLATSTAEVTALTYAATPNHLISASRDRQLQVWDLNTGQLHRRFAGHTEPIVGLQVVDDHTILSVSHDRALVWDLQREELRQVFSELSKPLTALLGDRHMTTVHDDGSVQVWTRDTGRLVRKISGQWQNLDAVLSKDHQYMVCLSPNQRLRVWQLNTSTTQ